MHGWCDYVNLILRSVSCLGTAGNVVVSPIVNPCRGGYRILVGRPEGKRSLERPRQRLQDDIKVNPQER